MLTTRRKQQAIRDLMNGLPPDVDYALLDKDYQVIWNVVKECENAADAFQALINLKHGDEEWQPDVDQILSLTAGKKIKHLSLQEISGELPPINWFWPGWVPNGMLTLMAAWPGIGKTYAALDVARRLLAGEPAPDGQPFQAKISRVIYVDAEDFLPIVAVRAAAWGMNTASFYPIRRPPRSLLDYNEREHQDNLIDMCYDLQPDLVIVDSLSSANSRGENAIEDMRDIMNFFVELPQAFNMALILIHHLRKPGKGTSSPVTMHDLRGSGHLTAMARSIIGMDTLNDDPNGPRWLKIIKTNLCKYPKPLAVKFNTNPRNPEVADLSYDQNAFALPDNLTGQCAEWLLETLADGPLSYEELKVLSAGKFSETVLQDARSKLNGKVINTVGHHAKGNKWALSDELTFHT